MPFVTGTLTTTTLSDVLPADPAIHYSIDRIFLQCTTTVDTTVEINIGGVIYQRVFLSLKGSGYTSEFQLRLSKNQAVGLKLSTAANVRYTIDYRVR